MRSVLGMIISAFSMHSISVVVDRHKREALLKHPSVWDVNHRAEQAASKALREKHARRTMSSTSIVSDLTTPWRDAREERSRGLHDVCDSVVLASVQPLHLGTVPIYSSHVHSN